MRHATQPTEQLDLPLRVRTWGGRRPGAGRKPGPRPRVPHHRRPPHRAAHPLHVTLRALPGLPSFRSARLFPAIQHAIRLASHEGFALVEFSVQSNHLHLIVEAKDREALSSGMRGLAIRVARAVNRVLERRGRVWADRYHARPLTTPREARAALVYVLMNHRKHEGAGGPVDRCSSAPWFRGWQALPQRLPAVSTPPAVTARTWLLQVGWRRHGLIRLTERPRSL